MLRILITGGISWSLIGMAFYGACLLFLLLVRDTVPTLPIILDWSKGVLLPAGICGLAWGVLAGPAFYIRRVSRLMQQSRRKARLLGGTAAALAQVVSPVPEVWPMPPHPIVDIVFLILSVLLGAWLAENISYRFTEDTMAHPQFANVFKAMVTFALLAAAGWACAGWVFALSFAGFLDSRERLPGEQYFTILKSGTAFTSVVGITFGVVSFILMTRAMSPERRGVSMQTPWGLVDSSEVTGVNTCLRVSLALWVALGYWFGKTFASDWIILALVMGVVVGLGANGVVPLAVHAIKRTTLLSSL